MAELASRVRLARKRDPAEHEGEDKEGTPSREAAMPVGIGAPRSESSTFHLRRTGGTAFSGL